MGVALRMLAFMVCVMPSTQPGQTSIATWYGCRAGALSLSFDDNSWDRPLEASILEEYGFRGTFGVVVGKMPSGYVEKIQSLFLAGHEIASHSWSHIDLTNASETVIHTEVVESKAAIEALTGAPCVTYIYAYGYWRNGVRDAVTDHYICARGAWQWQADNPLGAPVNSATGGDIYNLTINPFPEASGEPWADEVFLECLHDYVDHVLASNAWGIEMLHNLGQTNTTTTIREDVLRRHFEELAAMSDRALWVAPIGTVAKYYLERHQTQVEQAVTKPNFTVLRLTVGLDPNIYDVPLTLQTDVPIEWNGGTIAVEQDGMPLQYEMQIQPTSARLVYDVSPVSSYILVYYEPLVGHPE